MNDTLKTIRILNFLKIKELSEAMEISSSYLNEIENGKKEPSIKFLERFAEYFKLDFYSLLKYYKKNDSYGTKIKIMTTLREYINNL
ncbi:MAG: helix-turn-helix domain-containing protein [Candidatus Thorarchaeota archaeon]